MADRQDESPKHLSGVVNEFKVSSDRVFPVGDVGSMEISLKRIGEKASYNVCVSPHVG